MVIRKLAITASLAALALPACRVSPSSSSELTDSSVRGIATVSSTNVLGFDGQGKGWGINAAESVLTLGIYLPQQNSGGNVTSAPLEINSQFITFLNSTSLEQDRHVFNYDANSLRAVLSDYGTGTVAKITKGYEAGEDVVAMMEGFSALEVATGKTQEDENLKKNLRLFKVALRTSYDKDQNAYSGKYVIVAAYLDPATGHKSTSVYYPELQTGGHQLYSLGKQGFLPENRDHSALLVTIDAVVVKKKGPFGFRQDVPTKSIMKEIRSPKLAHQGDLLGRAIKQVGSNDEKAISAAFDEIRESAKNNQAVSMEAFKAAFTIAKELSQGRSVASH